MSDAIKQFIRDQDSQGWPEFYGEDGRINIRKLAYAIAEIAERAACEQIMKWAQEMPETAGDHSDKVELPTQERMGIIQLRNDNARLREIANGLQAGFNSLSEKLQTEYERGVRDFIHWYKDLCCDLCPSEKDADDYLRRGE